MERASRLPGESSAAQQRAANLRMVALASAVALAVVLPLAAATAGPAGSAGAQGPDKTQDMTRDGARGTSRDAARGAGEAEEPLVPGAAAEANGAHGANEAAGSAVVPENADAKPQNGRPGGGPSADPDEGVAILPARSSAQCGPELSSPEGAEAQTCVLTQGSETWARTYYRNATGEPLTAVLTLMAPDGRTVQVHCRLSASDDPDACETPREPTVRGHGSYTAVAEIASTKGNLMLRSGSNSPVSEED
ncbi:hypothetical protein WEB32_17895 [Streptomyces netropsis]|uniref:Uncharacterized protein n=1 Tax=Streptomyces netropsis TaxID=55404 RepID=A0A7W7LCT9_STRNE|nr:hypothetical protein [Streptomyces netropsis]MBB4887847.1 hypothetical protein [Streptomyces netropsis]GGR48272.1 hypothetical protein GCM10010219_62160 [Streptomyces netropsis]